MAETKKGELKPFYVLDTWWKKTVYVIGWFYFIVLAFSFLLGFVGAAV